MKITKKLVRLAVSGDDPWALGNKTLYELCRRHPTHTDTAEIVAKVWLIGRAYSASIERARGKAESAGLSNDRFYAEAVPDAHRECGIDEQLEKVAKFNLEDPAAIPATLAAHACLVKTFLALTNKEKRSLASKYLHFHLPDFFFIFDSRAAASIRALGVKPIAVKFPRIADRQYAQFVQAAIGLRAYVEKEFGDRLTPRQLDRLLLAIFESNRPAK